MTIENHPAAPRNGATRGVIAALLTPTVSDRNAGVGDYPSPTLEATRDRSAASAAPNPPAPDYPTPPALLALLGASTFDWFDDRPVVENFAALGRRLALAGDLYRAGPYAGGLLLASPDPHIPPAPVTDAAALTPIILDRLRVRVLKGGNVTGRAVPDRWLKAMLRCESFLQQFRAVDAVERSSRYLPDFAITRPGYNDGGYGRRILHVGPEPRVEPTLDAIPRFLEVMAFATKADRTNAVAAALTVLLRQHWPGGKPCLIVTSTKSHGGKETIVKFAAGAARQVSISYEAADWALQKAFVADVKADPELGLIDVENAHLGHGAKVIRSAFLERYLTDPEPSLYSPGTGAPVRRPNDIVVALTTNFGTVSDDLLNRGLPIHLEPVGDVAARVSPIGNPKLEFLPAQRDRIEAELRGMVEKWKDAGRPLDAAVKHPFGPWAQAVGGILAVNGFLDFLGNYTTRKTAAEPVRRALGLLGAARPDAWLRAAEWAGLAQALGLAGAIIPEAGRATDVGRERGMGVALSDHRDETFAAETEDDRLVLRLEKGRRRFVAGEEPSTRYRFAVLERQAIPVDPE